MIGLKSVTFDWFEDCLAFCMEFALFNLCHSIKSSNLLHVR